MQHTSGYKNAYKVLVGKPREKKQYMRYRSRWDDNIKIDLIEI
jgi:hypothetical protein